jgi:membrane protease YdiL (CAAX protease family)
MAIPTRSAPEQQHGSSLTRFIRSRPVLAFALLAFGLGWPLLTLHTITTVAHTAIGHLFTYGVLLGSAVLVTRVADGPGGARRLLQRLLVWQFQPWRWATVLLSMPALTIATAAAAGTLQNPNDGWLIALATYLFATVTGALLVNLPEEAAWAGVVQTRLSARRGLLRGALLTAPLFVAMHLPLQFAPGWTWNSVALGTTALIIAAPAFRYVIGDLLDGTRGSLLAAGMWHASFNASGQFDSPAGWETVTALLILTAGLAAGRHQRRRTSAAELSFASVPARRAGHHPARCRPDHAASHRSPTTATTAQTKP